MACPICANTYISDDVSVAERKGARVILRGTVKAVVSPNEAHYSPFSDYCKVALDPVSSRRGAGRRKYLKFRTQDELNKWGFVREQK